MHRLEKNCFKTCSYWKSVNQLLNQSTCGKWAFFSQHWGRIANGSLVRNRKQKQHTSHDSFFLESSRFPQFIVFLVVNLTESLILLVDTAQLSGAANCGFVCGKPVSWQMMIKKTRIANEKHQNQQPTHQRKPGWYVSTKLVIYWVNLGSNSVWKRSYKKFNFCFLLSSSSSLLPLESQIPTKSSTF